MKDRKIIMLYNIEDKLCLPIRELKKIDDKYYKFVCVNWHDKNIKSNQNLCYVLPYDTLVYDYLYPDNIEEYEQVLEDIYILKNNKNIKSL